MRNTQQVKSLYARPESCVYIQVNGISKFNGDHWWETMTHEASHGFGYSDQKIVNFYLKDTLKIKSTKIDAKMEIYMNLMKWFF